MKCHIDIVLVQREMESRPFSVAIEGPPLRGGSFQGMRKSIESDEEEGNGGPHRPPLIVFDEFPPGYPSARLLSSIAGFCFTRRVYFSADVAESPVRSGGLTRAS